MSNFVTKEVQKFDNFLGYFVKWDCLITAGSVCMFLYDFTLQKWWKSLAKIYWWHPDWPNCVLTKRKLHFDRRLFQHFLLHFVRLNRCIWSLCIKTQCMLTKINFQFTVNAEITHADWPNNGNLFDRMHYLPKVPTILMYWFSLTKNPFLFLWKIRCSYRTKKFPNSQNVLKI